MTGLTGEGRQGTGCPPGPGGEPVRDGGRGESRGRGPDREHGVELGRQGAAAVGRECGVDPGRDRAAERLARAALTRVLEPGDERAGAGSSGPARSS